jgi:CheY-like chemotaxis protein
MEGIYMTGPIKMPVTALVVDDTDDNRIIFDDILSDIGYDVTTEHTGEHALDILDSRTFTLAIIDLMLPEVNGLMILSEINKNPLHDKMITVIATANPHLVNDDANTAANYVIYKPINIAEFRELAENVKLQAGSHK